MNVLWEWVRNLTLVVVLFSFVEVLLPGSSMRKYLKFVFSLVLLAMILSPLTVIQGGDITAAGNVPVSDALREMEGLVQPAGEEEGIARVQTKQIEAVYREKLTAQLMEELKEKFSGITVMAVEIYINNEVRSSGFGKPERVSAAVSDADYEKPVRDFIADRLQLEKRNVTITFSEE